MPAGNEAMKRKSHTNPLVVGIDVLRAERLERLLTKKRRHRIAAPGQVELAGGLGRAFALKEAATKALGQRDQVRNLWDAMGRLEILGPERLVFDGRINLQARVLEDDEVVVAAAYIQPGRLHLAVESRAAEGAWEHIPETVQKLVAHRRDRIQAGTARQAATELVEAAGFTLSIGEASAMGQRVPVRVEGTAQATSVSWAHDGAWVAVAFLEAHDEEDLRAGVAHGPRAAAMLAATRPLS
jgi:phosphopantetheinyl transferase (holo-ACP synthase)